MLAPFFKERGSYIEVTPHEILGTEEAIQIKYDTLLDDLNPGDNIFINDGLVKLTVEEKTKNSLRCFVENGKSLN